MRDEEVTKDDWGKLFGLLDTGLELKPADREPWLRGLNVAEALKERLRQLLAERSRFQENGFLETPAARPPPPDNLTRKPAPSAAVAPREPEPEMPTAVRDLSILPNRDPDGGANRNPSGAPHVGMMIKGRYTLTDELGQGGMGHVFKARDQRRWGRDWAPRQGRDWEGC